MVPKQKFQMPNHVPKKEPEERNFMKYLNYEYAKSFLFDYRKIFPVACALVLIELVINLMIIHRVKYTEIDWKAYMQEVEGAMNGTLDYAYLKGDTGPLVYPAGFVYIFSGLYFLTNQGRWIMVAQYIFGILYLLNLMAVARLHMKAKKIPPYVLILTCLTSYRIHSIYALRLFNDPVAMLLLYVSLNFFIDSRWSLGSIFYSLAVSVKMNILLFAPALLLSYLVCLGLKDTIKQLTICATIQLVLGLPFLYGNAISYIIGAFNLGRVFLFEWTVNWRFLPEHVFVSPFFHLSLLTLHLLLLLVFYKPSLLYLQSYAKLKFVESEISSQLKKEEKVEMSSSSRLFLYPMFVANLIGIACSRSLHYQFYVWYFHTLPFLLWSTHYSVRTRLVILGVIELCWNTFPSTSLSSLSLHICHVLILYGLYKNHIRTMQHQHKA